jgi:hypothetical protein
MSERLTARILWPSRSGSVACDEVTALDHHVDGEDQLVARRGREDRRVVADADANVAVARGAREVPRDQRELAAQLRPALARASADLGGAHRRRVAVEHAVDELVAVRAAVRLRELDRLVDDDAVRDVQAVLELPRADREDRALDRRSSDGGRSSNGASRSTIASAPSARPRHSASK